MISAYIDTNTINSRQNDPFINQIEELTEKYSDNLIIEKTDTLDTELSENSKYNSNRLKKSSNYIESYGIAVLGHSRLGHTVLGSKVDREMFSEILEIIFGKKLQSEYTKQEIRDAMHVMTTIRYGGTYFITNDRIVLNSSDKLKNRYNSVIICTPKEALEKIKLRFKTLGINIS